MAKLCIIPARGGSKRIPRKNIKEFYGYPIIYYSIKTAIDSGLFDEIMVSTDDKEIASISKKFGASVPFYRSKKTSDDFATTGEVILEVIKTFSKKGRDFDSICCIYPTAPFVTTKRLKEGFEILCMNDVKAVVPVTKFSYSIFRSLKIEHNNFVTFNWPKYEKTRSQDLPDSFHDAGQWYWIDVFEFLKSGRLIGNKSAGLEIDLLEVQDIDNEIDWKLAELKFELINRN